MLPNFVSMMILGVRFGFFAPLQSNDKIQVYCKHDPE
jgi:hypothetical protein